MSDIERDRLLRDIHARVTAIADRVTDHHEALFGNGHPGLKADLQRIDLQQQQCPARLATTQAGSNLRASWAAVWIALALGAANTVMAVVQWAASH